jgi:hypothetical protein
MKDDEASKGKRDVVDDEDDDAKTTKVAAAKTTKVNTFTYT